MKKPGARSLSIVMSAILSIMMLAGVANAGLSEAGPINPANGFSSWYKDNTPPSALFPTGVPLELCLDPNAGCILPILGQTPTGAWISEEPDNYDPNKPVKFFVTGKSEENPIGHVRVAEGGNYPGESFYYYATATGPVGPDPGRIVYIAAIEAAFAGTGEPGEGMQNPFVRIRIDLDKVTPGTYTISHPYGAPQVLEVDDKGAARYVSDVPLKIVSPFTDTATTMKTFLLPAATTGGAALAPVMKGTSAYLSDVAGPVTNGPFGRNVVRVSGPNGVDTISDFTVTAKISAEATALTVTTAPTSPAAPGTPVVITATCTDANQEYRYSLIVNGVKTVKQDWLAVTGNTSTWTWDTTGLPIGTYSILVEARPVGAIDATHSKTIGYVLVPKGRVSSASSVKLIATPGSPRVAGTQISFAAAGVGRSEMYEYRYSVLSPKSKKYGTPTAWSSDLTWTWDTTALPAGLYRVKVEARALGTATVRTKTMPFNIR